MLGAATQTASPPIYGRTYESIVFNQRRIFLRSIRVPPLRMPDERTPFEWQRRRRTGSRTPRGLHWPRGVSVSRGDVRQRLSGLLRRPFRGLGRDAFKPFLTPFGAQEYATGDAENHAQQQQTEENPEPATSLALRGRSEAGHPPVVVRCIQPRVLACQRWCGSG